jgi:hypothetical protein
MTLFLLLACLVVVPGTVVAQQKPPDVGSPSAPDTADLKLIADGWSLLAKGDLAGAAAKAAEAATISRRNTAALALGLEVEIVRTHALGGLDFYERWLGSRALEEPAMLRRIALATLREEAAQQQEVAARIEALRGLAEDGEAWAAAALHAAGSQAGVAASHALAAEGNQEAVQAVIEGLSGPSVDVRSIAALGASGRAEALEPLAELLTDPRQEVRGFAAEAIGRLGRPDAAARLVPLLSDKSAWVRAKAAGALFRLGDTSAEATLQELAADPLEDVKLLAAEGLAVRPDAAWMALIRELTASSTPQVRATAAKLVAAHDPELARSVLEPLLASKNGAIRELASQALSEAVISDLTLLRRLLRSPARLSRVRAASRVLALTR